MKYVSIDIETTGLDPETCQIIQIGAVIEDTNDVKPIDELPKFQCIVEHERYSGQPTALAMNHGIIEKLAQLDRASKEERSIIRKQHNILPVGIVAQSFSIWLQANGIDPNPESKTQQVTITAAGKNFATFDKVFLQKLPNWQSSVQIKQRVIDPAILYMNWQNEESLPNLTECMRRANITDVVTHDALQDSIDVIRILRYATSNYTVAY